MVLLFALTFTFYASPVYAADPTPTPTPTSHPCSLDPKSPEYTSYVAKYGPCSAGLTDIEQVFTNVVSVMVGLGFVALLVLLILAGFKYLTSGGEQKALQSAHQTVTWALLGILFMAIAWLLLQLIENFTGVKVTVFDIKTLVR